MKKYVKSSENNQFKLSQCSFDFDLGRNYDQDWLEDEICNILWDYFDCDVTGVDFRSVDYPGGKKYSQCSFDFQWQDSYDADGIEEALINLIDDAGGNFFGIDFYSLS